MKIINEIIFWLHFALIPVWFYASVVLSPVLILTLVFLYRTHTKIFKGCAVSKLQQKLGGMKENQTFMENFCKRIFKLNLKNRPSKIIGNIIWAFPLFVAIFKIIPYIGL